MMQESLADVLQLPVQKRWHVLEQISMTRDLTSLKSITLQEKEDATSLQLLIKKITIEIKRSNYSHVIVLLRVIRWGFVDSEAIMKVLVRAGLDQILLSAIEELCRKSKESSEYIIYLEQFFSNLADLFEWDFFGAHYCSNYMAVILQILSLPYDCVRNLFQEVANTLMSMMSTYTTKVCDILKQDTKIEDALKKLLHDLPKAKSFHYEALLLEIAYRIFRLTKKSGDTENMELGLRIIESLPLNLPSELKLVPPKLFKDSTRKLLNSFNSQVGIVKSFVLKNIVCHNINKKIDEWNVQWADIGGAVIESEVVYQEGDGSFPALFKIPFDAIRSLSPTESTKTIAITLCDGTSLENILEGGGDMNWVTSHDCTIDLCFDAMSFVPALNVLRARSQKDKIKGSVMVKSKCCDPTQEIFTNGPAKRKGRAHTENGATHVVIKSELENLRASSTNDNKKDSTATNNKTSTRGRKRESYRDSANTKKRKASSVALLHSGRKNRILTEERSLDDDQGNKTISCQQLQTTSREGRKIGSKETPVDITHTKAESTDGRKLFRDRHGFRAKNYDLNLERVKDALHVPAKNLSRKLKDKTKDSLKLDNIQRAHNDSAEISKGEDQHHTTSKEARQIFDRIHQVFRSTMNIDDNMRNDYEVAQRNLCKQMRNLIDKIMCSRQSYCQKCTDDSCKKLLSEYGSKMNSLADALERLDGFAAISDEQQCRNNERKESEKQILHHQSGITDAIDALSSTHHGIKTELEEIQANFIQAKDQFRHHARKMTKKLKARADTHLTEARIRIQSIENSFSADDLMAMQQMLAKI